MLQQTQVKTVVPFFDKFIEKYPNLDALLKASEDEILAQWSGLGFYRRAKNIYKACRVISEDFNSKVPTNINDLESLPGIGRSTAGAIMSIAFNEGHPILDANVKRVLGRYKKISFKTENEKQKKLWLISEELTPNKESFEYTQGIMDLGATICHLRSPKCSICPLNISCKSAFKDFKTVKKVKKQKSIKRINFTLAHSNQSFLLFKKNEQSFWESLWTPYDNQHLNSKSIFKDPKKVQTRHLNHALSHIDLDITVEIFEYDKPFKIETNLEHQWINKSEINDFGLPKPIKTIILTYV